MGISGIFFEDELRKLVRRAQAGQPGGFAPLGDDGKVPGQYVEGIQGPAGPPGDPGAPGTPGSPGSVGETGPQGSPGTPGAAGDQGVQGVPGNPGGQGEQGIQGIPGTPGVKGDTGNTGNTGPAGPAPAGTGFVRVTAGVLEAPVATAPPSSHDNTAHTTAYEAANANIQAHVTAAHAPAAAQANADITKAEIEAKLTGAIASHSHSGGADPFIAKLVLAADKATGANVTPVTLGLSFNYEANSKYVIDFYMLVAPTAASTGCGFPIDVSTAVTHVGDFLAHQLAITGTLSGSGSIGDLGVTSQGVSSGMVSTGIQFVGGQGSLITAANTGTATFNFRSETTAVTTCKAGSMIRVMKLA